MDNRSNRNFHLQGTKKMCDYDKTRLNKALQGTPRNYKNGVAPFLRNLGFTDKMANMSLAELYAYMREIEKGGADNE